VAMANDSINNRSKFGRTNVNNIIHEKSIVNVAMLCIKVIPQGRIDSLCKDENVKIQLTETLAI
jgi:hypothetical protein